jgi:hypothetical protein
MACFNTIVCVSTKPRWCVSSFKTGPILIKIIMLCKFLGDIFTFSLIHIPIHNDQPENEKKINNSVLPFTMKPINRV